MGIPVVVIDCCPPDIGLPYITSDNYQGGFDTVNYLISMRHRKIACLQCFPESQSTIDRVMGYKDAFNANDIPINETLIMGDNYSLRKGYIQTRILFSMDDLLQLFLL